MASWALAVVLAGLTTLAYANAVHGGLVHDDTAFNPTVQPSDAATLLRLFGESAWAGVTSTVDVYRPLLLVGFALEKVLHGPDLRWFHAVNVGLHVTATLVLFGLLRALLKGTDPRRQGLRSALPAFVAALVFGVHPIHTDAVDSIFNRSDVVVALCSFGAMWLVWSHGRQRPALAWTGAGALYLTALLHKESAVSLPLLLALMFALRPISGGWRELRDRLAPILWLAIPAVVYLLLRRSALGALVTASQATMSFGQRITFTASTITEALRMIVWPHPLRASYADARPEWPLAACAFVAILLGAAWGTVRSVPSLFVGFGGFLLALFPSTRLFTGLLIHSMGERHLYVPSGFLALALAFGVARAVERWGNASLVAPLLLVPTLGLTTWDRNKDWHSNVALFEAEASAAPEAGDSWRLLTGAYLGTGRYEDAARACDTRLALHRDLPLLANNCALAYDHMGRDADAERAYRLAAELGLGSVARHNLGRFLARMGRTEEAEVEYQRSAAEEVDPVRQHYRRGMAILLFQPERLAAARAEFEAALALQPRYQPARQALEGMGPR